MGEGAFPTDSVLIKSDHPVEGEVENQSSNVQRNYTNFHFLQMISMNDSIHL